MKKNKIQNKIFIVLCILVISINSFGQIQSTADWLQRFDDYANEPLYPLYDDYHTGDKVDAHTYWSILSSRGAVAYTHAGHGENTFEDLSYGLDALLAAYEATGYTNTTYFDELLMLCNNLIIHSQLCLPDEPGFNTSVTAGFIGYKQNLGGDANITEEIKPWRYVLKFCRIIYSNTSLTQYRSQADQYVEFVNYNIWHKWMLYKPSDFTNTENRRQNFFQATIHITSNWAFIASDLLYIFSNYSPTIPSPWYLSEYGYVRSKFNSILFNSAEINAANNTYDFNIIQLEYLNDNTTIKTRASYDNVDCRYEIDDVSHGNFVVSYILEDMELFSNFTVYPQITYLCNTFKLNIWKHCAGNTSLDLMATMVDGNTATDNLCHGDLTLSGNDVGEGWAKLGRYSCDLQHILEDYISCGRKINEVDGGTLPFHQQYYKSALCLYAQMALNAKILDARAPNLNIDGDITQNRTDWAGQISVAYNQATTIESSANVAMVANNSITFYPGFHTEFGCTMTAFIDPSLCFSPARLMAVENEPNHSPNNPTDSALTAGNDIQNNNTIIIDSRGNAATNTENTQSKPNKNTTSDAAVKSNTNSTTLAAGKPNTINQNKGVTNNGSVKNNTNSNIFASSKTITNKGITNNSGVEGNTFDAPLSITLTPTANNPGQFSVSSNTCQPLNIEVFDAMGRQVYSASNINTQSTQQISIKPYSTGIYFLKFYDTLGNMAVKKVMVN